MIKLNKTNIIKCPFCINLFAFDKKDIKKIPYVSVNDFYDGIECPYCNKPIALIAEEKECNGKIIGVDCY